MTLYWKDYCRNPRIALVHRASEECTDRIGQHEVLTISPSQIMLKSDGYALPLSKDMYDRFQCLNTGDIVTIDEHGMIYQLFNINENDATFFLTGYCNSNCIMCPSTDSERSDNNGMPVEWLLEYLDLLPDTLNHIVVTGGEPTLRAEAFFRVMEKIADRFSEIETLLLTNGRSFASKYMVDRLIAHCPQYLMVAIPIHGPNAEIHDSITRSKGGFLQTRAGILHLLAAGIGIELRIVVSKRNYLYLRQYRIMRNPQKCDII